MSQEDQELLSYFFKHYKHSNKGIKGRGKNRSVSSNLKHSKRPAHGPTPRHFTIRSFSPGPYATGSASGPSFPGYYRGGYEGADRDEVQSSLSPSSSLGPMYEDDGKSLAFGDRIY